MLKILCLILFFIPSISFALDMDFYTYGGFNETLTAFQRIALIFNDGQYIVLFFIACLFGIMFGGVISFVKGFMGQEGGGAANSFSFMIYVLFGVAIFKAMILPQGTVHIYDPVLNRFQAVGGVPDIIVALSGFTNKLERGVTESLDSSSAHPRELQGGGKGLEMFINAFYGDPLDNQAYLAKSLGEYISDCLPPAESLPAYSFDLEAIKSNTANLKNELSKLVSESVFTVYYSSSDKSGTSLSCQGAWNILEAKLNDGALYDSYIHDVCSQSGFDVGDVAVTTAQTARCKEIIEDTGDLLFSPGVFTGTDKLMEDILITRQVILSLSTTPASALTKLANRDITQTGLASQMVSENWLPTIRSVVFALVLGIMPVIMLFLVTPMVFKALHLGTGLFLFICIWGVTDAVVHGVSTDQIITMMEGLKTGTMGLNQIMMMPDQALKGLAIIGKSQSMGIVLASLITAFFFKISSYAFNQMSEKYQQDIDRFGDDAAHKTLTPEGRLHAANTHAEVEAMGHVSTEHGLDGYIGAQSMPSVESLSSSIAHSNALNGSGGGTPSIGGRMDAAYRTGQLEGSDKAGSTLGTEGLANLNNVDPNSLARNSGIKSSVSRGGDTLAAQDVAANRNQSLVETVGDSSYSDSANSINNNLEKADAIRAASDPNAPLVDSIQQHSRKAAIDEVSQGEAAHKSNEFISKTNNTSIMDAAIQRHENMNASGVGKAVEFGDKVEDNYDNEHYQAHADRVKVDSLEERISADDLGKGQAISESASSDAKVHVENSQGYSKLVDGEILPQELAIKKAEAAKDLQNENGMSQDEHLSKIAMQQEADQLGDAQNFERQKELLDVNNTEVADKRAGASNNNLALNQDDVDLLHQKGVISDENYTVSSGGAHGNITLDSDGNSLNSRLESGSSAESKNDTSYSRQTEVETGLRTDGQTISDMLRTPDVGYLIMDSARNSDENRNEFTSQIADELGKYTDSSITASDEVFLRNSAYANASASVTTGASVTTYAEAGVDTPVGGGGVKTSAHVSAEANATVGLNNEVGKQGSTADIERIDAHKATAEKWFDEAEVYAQETIQSYQDSGLPLDDQNVRKIETGLMKDYISDRMDSVEKTERDRMFEIASGEHAPVVEPSDSYSKNIDHVKNAKSIDNLKL